MITYLPFGKRVERWTFPFDPLVPGVSYLAVLQRACTDTPLPLPPCLLPPLLLLLLLPLSHHLVCHHNGLVELRNGVMWVTVTVTVHDLYL